MPYPLWPFVVTPHFDSGCAFVCADASDIDNEWIMLLSEQPQSGRD
jgi:hypothetical protein